MKVYCLINVEKEKKEMIKTQISLFQEKFKERLYTDKFLMKTFEKFNYDVEKTNEFLSIPDESLMGNLENI